MEYSARSRPLNAAPSSPHVKNKLFFLCAMLSLWVYLVYCCAGYCTSIPPPVPPRTAHGRDGSVEGASSRDGSVGGVSSRDLLNNDNEADSRAYDWEDDPGGEARIQGDDGVSNGSEVKRFPQAIIIGVKKGGTRALLEFLRAHPDVRAVGAEPHFFDRNYEKGLEWYRELMPPTLEGQLTMEKTPSYFVTEDVPRRIHNMSSSTKLLVVVRDPVTRAVSDYTQTRSKRPDIPSFQSLVFRNGSAPAVDDTWSAVQIGLYAKHLERWRRHFPAAQLLLVSGERLIADPSGEMARVQDFLGLRRAVADRHFSFDAAKGFPCLRRPAGGPPRCLGKTKGRTHPRVPARALQRLREFYRPHNHRFYQMTGHDFGWD